MSSSNLKDTPESPVMLEDAEKDLYSINSGDDTLNKGRLRFSLDVFSLELIPCIRSRPRWH